MAQIKGPYSNEVHDFISRSLEYSEEQRASLDDHEKFLRPYQKEANEVTLDFKKRALNSAITGKDFNFVAQPVKKVTKELPSDTFFDKKVIIKTEAPTNKAVTGEDFNFGDPQAVKKQKSLALPTDAYFEKQEVIIEKPDKSIVKQPKN